jgi:cobaltochelatase CobN
MNKKKYLLTAVVAVIAVVAGVGLWHKYASVTRVALFNYQPFQVSNISLSNTDKFVEYEYVPVEEVDKLKKYDFVLIFGMGLKVTEEQRGVIQAAMDKGISVYSQAVTNPANSFCNIDSVHIERITSYLTNANKANYQNLARYIRRNIDNKSLFAAEAQPPVESISDAFFHIDENVAFTEVNEFEAYLKKNGFYTEGGKKVALLAGIHDPYSGNKEHLDSLIVSLQNSGLNVYPVTSTKRIEYLEKIKPDAVIYFPHGRVMTMKPDVTVDWLKAHNVPIFAPLTILQLKEEWMNNPMGMFGGFMGQTVVMPELDGAIYPYSLVAQEKTKENLYVFRTIPDRLRSFTSIVNNVLELRTMNNRSKRVAIYYFKGAGQETLAAQGLETVPSLYNFLKRLRAEGYSVDNLPATEVGFEKMLMTQGAVLNTYAEGAFDDFMKNGNPALVSKTEYEQWTSQTLSPQSYKEVVNTYGEAPGAYMSVTQGGEQYVAVARIQLGNVVLLPQPMAALGDDNFAIVHGAKMPPPHTYIASYLWVQNSFKADALIHFGTHGSLEFTPQKQVALDSNDWSDRLVGTIPHFYYYTIGNVGESMMAKRRSYATTVSYLTQPFMESNTRAQFSKLNDWIREFYKAEGSARTKAGLQVKKIAIDMGLHLNLRLDTIEGKPYSDEDIERIENFAEEISTEKMNGELYVSGVSYSPEKINSTVMAMSADPIAYSLASLDKLRGKVNDTQLKSKVYFTANYLNPAKGLVSQVLAGKPVSEDQICKFASITTDVLAGSKAMLAPSKPSMPFAAKPSTSRPSMPAAAEHSKEQKAQARAIVDIERTINNIAKYKKALEESPEAEFRSMLNAMAGGYIAPSSGGDAVANPNAVPTGHNMYSVNAETTPSEIAWDKGVELANTTLENYKKAHGVYPRKVSYTFWSSEFVESEGATIAQVLYMLGVEPIRDSFGRVSELRLIPSEELGRPRIDVVVQTSGQFRDLAASRLMLISKAVDMASAAKDDGFENMVAKSTLDIERELVERGVSPKDARDLSTRRVFGGINGMYGTGIQEMITSSDKWESEKEIADTYINNMGADYGSEKNWGEFQAGLLRTVLSNTDVIVQPRQNNTWGALSLDHVYEFMGGMNLAIRNVTGKDPDAYFADYRNRTRAKLQDLKEAIGVEARTTVLNPAYIKEVMKGKAGSAAQIEEVVTNTFGWNVAKPDVIDNEMWDELYEVYVKDKFNLGTEKFFRNTNPAVLQEVTAIMMESARKGMWKATDEQLNTLAKVHTDMVRDFGSTGSGFAGSNAKLQDFISKKVSADDAKAYNSRIQNMKQADVQPGEGQKGMVLKKDQVVNGSEMEETSINGFVIAMSILVAFVVLLIFIRRKRKNSN